jgi:hypothetical protein
MQFEVVMVHAALEVAFVSSWREGGQQDRHPHHLIGERRVQGVPLDVPPDGAAHCLGPVG